MFRFYLKSFNPVLELYLGEHSFNHTDRDMSLVYRAGNYTRGPALPQPTNFVLSCDVRAISLI